MALDSLTLVIRASLSRPAARGHFSWKTILSHNGCLSSKFNSKSRICHCGAFGVVAEPPPHPAPTRRLHAVWEKRRCSHTYRGPTSCRFSVTPEESLRNGERREKSGSLPMDWPRDGRPPLRANRKPSPPRTHCKRLRPGDAAHGQRGHVRAQGSPRQGLTPARLAQAAEG